MFNFVLYLFNFILGFFFGFLFTKKILISRANKTLKKMFNNLDICEAFDDEED